MKSGDPYDVVIVGGGLSGLSAGILLCRKGHRVAVAEKEVFPFHRVCGEYVSMESFDFLRELGIPLDAMELPEIHELQLTAPNGKMVVTRLQQGGFGISRYKLDHLLAVIAKREGVHLLEGTKVLSIAGKDPYELEIQSGETGKQVIQAKICLSAHGKKSNLDVKWNREFLKGTDKRLENYLGVKYHIRYPWPANRIALHNFRKGYCGISAIDEGWNCLCYLTHASNLKNSGNDMERMEREVLSENPHLRKIFSGMKKRDGFPVAISQISFRQKSLLEEGVLMLGDAAGMITPLCGNGMSIALHTGKIAAGCVHLFLRKQVSKDAMMRQYCKEWNLQFSARLGRGRMIQRFFGNPLMSNVFVSTFRMFPFLAQPVVKMTHGKPF